MLYMLVNYAQTVSAILGRMRPPIGRACGDGSRRSRGDAKDCGGGSLRVAALGMMPLNRTLLYTTHGPGPLAAEISAGPVIDVSAQACDPEDCPVGPFVHEEEELEAPAPSKFLVIAAQPGSLMVVHEG